MYSYSQSSSSSSNYKDIPTATAVVEEDYGTNGKKVAGYGSGYNQDVQVLRGEVQSPAFRDPFFGFLFWVQLLTVIILTAMYASGAIEVDFKPDETTPEKRHLTQQAGRFLADTVSDINFTPIMVGSVSALAIAPMLTVWMFGPLYRNAIALIQFSIYMAVGVNVFLTVMFLVSGMFWPALLTGLGAFLTAMYARYVWNRIPLAAANLKTAIASIQSQLGVAFLGLAGVVVYALWWVLWIAFFVCTLNTPFMLSQVSSTKVVHSGGFKGDDDFVNTLDTEYSPLYMFLTFLMLLSFYWTNQVICNTIQATVAGAVGTFWFVPEEAVGCCSSGLTSSAYRSVTYSFGSICMGSLIVAFIQALRAVVQQMREQARNSDGGSIILCIADCLLSMLEAAAEYFNKWAFIYVGLYGYSYMEAGHNVLTLFRERGWTSIISDNLTARVLGMMSFAIGLGTGLIAAFISALVSFSLHTSDGSWGAQAGGSLIIALIAGWILASVVLTVVNSAADTVIVLFAEAPNEFLLNHPMLATEMNNAWAQGYPDMFTPTHVPSMVV